MSPEELINRLKDLKVPHEEIAQVLGRNRVQATKMLAGRRMIKFQEVEPLTALVHKWEHVREAKAARPADAPRGLKTYTASSYLVGTTILVDGSFQLACGHCGNQTYSLKLDQREGSLMMVSCVICHNHMGKVSLVAELPAATGKRTRRIANASTQINPG